MVVCDGTDMVALASAGRYKPAYKLFFSSQSTYAELMEGMMDLFGLRASCVDYQFNANGDPSSRFFAFKASVISVLVCRFAASSRCFCNSISAACSFSTTLLVNANSFCRMLSSYRREYIWIRRSEILCRSNGKLSSSRYTTHSAEC